MTAIEDRRTAPQRREAALHARVEQEQARFDRTFGSDDSWMGADLSDNGEIKFLIHRYVDFQGGISMTREQAINLRDFLNENIK